MLWASTSRGFSTRSTRSCRLSRPRKSQGEGRQMHRVNVEILRAYEALRTRLEREEGQALVEYALILALIAVVSIIVLNALGLNVSRIFKIGKTQLWEGVKF